LEDGKARAAHAQNNITLKTDTSDFHCGQYVRQLQRWRQTMNSRIGFWVAGGLVVLGGFGFLFFENGSQTATAPTPSIEISTELPPTVQVLVVEKQMLKSIIMAPGEFVIANEVVATSEGDNQRIVNVFVGEGRSVVAGQPLAELESAALNAQIVAQEAAVKKATIALAFAKANQSAQMLRAKSQLASQSAQAEQAARDIRRVSGLQAKGIVSRDGLEQKSLAGKQSELALAVANADLATAQAGELNLDLAAADMVQAEADLKVLQVKRDKLFVKAPKAGTIYARNAKPGEFVSASGQPMFRIIEDGLIELAAKISERDLLKLSLDGPATVVLPDGSELAGKIRVISPLIDPQTRLGKVLIALPYDMRLRPGGFGQAKIEFGASELPVVPERALVETADGSSVYTLNNDNTVKPVKVQTVMRRGGLAGLQSDVNLVGQTIIVSGAAFVGSGDKVTPQLSAGKGLQP
jgi:HlyD family secretion protein